LKVKNWTLFGKLTMHTCGGLFSTLIFFKWHTPATLPIRPKGFPQFFLSRSGIGGVYDFIFGDLLPSWFSTSINDDLNENAF